MDKQRLLTIKPSFHTQWLALSLKEERQIHKKIEQLLKNPLPDGDVKKQLKYKDRNLYRLRSGDYRIFYTYDASYVGLLALRRRQEDTYDEDIEAALLGSLNISDDFYEEIPSLVSSPSVFHEMQDVLLPKPITKDLLQNLRIADEYHSQLLCVKTEDELLNTTVPQDSISRVLDYLFPPQIHSLLLQPDQIVPHVDDLLELSEKKYLNFLLRLTPEQERAARWSKNVTGPTHVKGKPGTGKSTVALHRVCSILESLLRDNVSSPCVLFTTYTKSLEQSSQQLLEQLLGENIRYVRVTTADSIVWSLINESRASSQKIAHEQSQLGMLKLARGRLQKDDNILWKSIIHLSPEYLLEEINCVIVARDMQSLEDYVRLDRSGRSRDVRLGTQQRQAVWKLYEKFYQKLAELKQCTWQSLRVLAAKIHERNITSLSYDGVIIDEAQDLDPSVLRLLFNACKAPERFFITTDANQSIYGTGFAWREVHEGLRFQGGRTTVLRTNYRSTKQIGEAAQSYLSDIHMAETDPTECCTYIVVTYLKYAVYLTRSKSLKS